MSPHNLETEAAASKHCTTLLAPTAGALAQGLDVGAGPQAGERDGQALHVHGGGDLAAADVGGDVVAEGVAQVVRQVRQRALAGGLCLQQHRMIGPKCNAVATT